jgi:hypothetical protein
MACWPRRQHGDNSSASIAAAYYLARCHLNYESYATTTTHTQVLKAARLLRRGDSPPRNSDSQQNPTLMSRTRQARPFRTAGLWVPHSQRIRVLRTPVRQRRLFNPLSQTQYFPSPPCRGSRPSACLGTATAAGADWPRTRMPIGLDQGCRVASITG